MEYRQLPHGSEQEKLQVTAEAVKNSFTSVQIVHRADKEFPFLHDTMIFRGEDKLIMAWYNCTENEIQGRTVIRVRYSADNGKTWTEPEILCEDENGRHMVPVTFSEYNGDLWAYVTIMSAHDRAVGYACVHYENGSWIIREERKNLVLLNTLPQEMEGKWIMGGRRAARLGELPQIPVVAVADMAAPAEWKIIDIIPQGNTEPETLPCPETALLINGKQIEAFIRNDAGCTKISMSSDGGESWSTFHDTVIPIAPAKICAGTLPDGRQYLIYNEITPKRDRSRLVMALRNDSNSVFSKVWILAEGYEEELQAGPYWHYPCAAISDGVFHVSCTVSGEGVIRHAALFSIPLDKL